jgi:hypothetical protein
VKFSESTNYLLGWLNIPQADKAQLEDWSFTIQTSQMEKDMAELNSSRKGGPAIPLTPHRSVEHQVAGKQHRMWVLGNINLLAPLPIPVWKFWTNMTNTEVEMLKRNTVTNSGLLRDSQLLVNYFALSMYDHHKCPSTMVRVFTKQDLPTGHGRSDKHSSSFWNCQRPYLHCGCKTDNTCKGAVIWFDHAVWFMINNLDRFFGEFPSMAAKFGAFII